MDIYTTTIALSILVYIVIGNFAGRGVRNLDDLEDLCQIAANGTRLSGVVVGREITEGRFTFEEAKATVSRFE
jgi:phosphoribosylformimino-5-aminoimidazole carboxamide ribonucleotide (ProFAR) isomerase